MIMYMILIPTIYILMKSWNTNADKYQCTYVLSKFFIKIYIYSSIM